MALLDGNAMRLLDRLSLPLRGGATATRQGGHLSKEKASGLELADHRAYIPGDDIRHIDWKAFARHRQLTLRQFAEERDARIYVLLDVSPSMDCGAPSKLAVAKQIAFSFAYLGMKQLDQVHVLPFDSDLGDAGLPLSRREQAPVLDARLAKETSRGETDFLGVTRLFARRGDRRGLVIVISDLLATSGFPEGFKLLGQLGHEVRLVRVRSAADEQPDLRGDLELVDAETGQVLHLRATAKLLAGYRDALREHVKQVESAARRSGARLAVADVAATAEQNIKAIFAAPGSR